MFKLIVVLLWIELTEG